MDALRLTAQRRPCDTRRRRACCALLSSACTRRLRQPGRPAPVVAAGQVAVERAAGGTPVALRGSLAVHGVTTWFLVDLAAGRVLLRDARGPSRSVELAAAPEAVRQLVEPVRAAQSHGNGESIVRSSEVVAGPVRLSTSHSATRQRENAEFLLRIDEAALFERIRVVRASLDWQWLVLAAPRGQAVALAGDDAATPG